MMPYDKEIAEERQNKNNNVNPETQQETKVRLHQLKLAQPGNLPSIIPGEVLMLRLWILKTVKHIKSYKNFLFPNLHL